MGKIFHFTVLQAMPEQDSRGPLSDKTPVVVTVNDPFFHSRSCSPWLPQPLGAACLHSEVGTNLIFWVRFWQNGFFANFFFGAAGFFFADFAAGFFSSFLWGQVPRKILQENPWQNPPNFAQQKSTTYFCRGAGPIIFRVTKCLRENALKMPLLFEPVFS